MDVLIFSGVWIYLLIILAYKYPVMASHNPIHGGAKAAATPAGENEAALLERLGLSTEQADASLEKWGYNELPTINIPLWYVFMIQFTGTMPYMLELACILALTVSDYTDFSIIFLMICCNGWLGFHEELKAKASLVLSIFTLLFNLRIYC